MGGLGLSHISMAAEAANTEVTMRQEGDMVIFELIVDVDTEPDAASTQQPTPRLSPHRLSISDFPPGLCICVIDDSQVSRPCGP